MVALGTTPVPHCSPVDLGALPLTRPWDQMGVDSQGAAVEQGRPCT